MFLGKKKRGWKAAPDDLSFYYYYSIKAWLKRPVILKYIRCEFRKIGGKV